MITKEECYYLGLVTKATGFKGELVFFLDVDDPARYRRLDSVFIELNGQLVPFFIEQIQVKKDTALVKLEGIDTLQQAEQLLKADLYLPLSLLPPLKGNSFYFHEVIGFRVIDSAHGEIGVVEKVLDFPQQEILQVKKDYKEILIPVLKHIIRKVDRKNRVIEIEAPEGLIELYLRPEQDEDEASPWD